MRTGTDTEWTWQEASELTAVVDDLLDSLSAKFASVSSEIYEKIEAMSRRLDAMEQGLQAQAQAQATTAQVKEGRS